MLFIARLSLVATMVALAACGSSDTEPAETLLPLPDEQSFDGSTVVGQDLPDVGQSPVSELPEGDGDPLTSSVTAGAENVSTSSTPSVPTTSTAVAVPGSSERDLDSIDWWGCWRAGDAVGSKGGLLNDGARVALLPNCATGRNSIGSSGDMSHPDNPPIFRASAALGNPSIEFTHVGDTLLQTNGVRPLPDDTTMDSSNRGMTLVWVGMMTDVESHDIKFIVTGLDWDSQYPMVMVVGEGLNRFTGYGGASEEIHSERGSITDLVLVGLVLYLPADGSPASLEVDGVEVTAVDAGIGGDVNGLTLGNMFARGFSTTDHQFVFLGVAPGPLDADQKQVVWDYVDSL